MRLGPIAVVNIVGSAFALAPVPTSGGYEVRRWIIDPLDDTVNYASGLPWFSVTVAYQEQGRTVLGLTHAPAAGLIARYAFRLEQTQHPPSLPYWRSALQAMPRGCCVTANAPARHN